MHKTTALRTWVRPRGILLLAMIFAAGLSGCALSVALFPLYDKTTVTTNDALVGKWDYIDTTGSSKQTECCWTFEKEGDHYIAHIADTDDNQDWVSDVHLVKLGDTTFFDAEPGKITYSQMTQVAFPAEKTHLIGQMTIDKDTVKIAVLNEDWLEGLAEKGTPPVAMAVSDDEDVFLTAKTPELQAFVRKYANDTNAFPVAWELRRHSGN
jgi:hypothetical protein